MIVYLFLCLIFPSIVFAEDIVVGNTYPIVEKDSLKELEAKASAVKWNDVTRSARNKLKEYRPADFSPLPHTKKSRKYKRHIIHTVEFDVTDEHGEVIYPKGYQFNPLDYVTLPYGMLFIDGSEKSHIDWAKQYIKEHSFTQVFIVNGSVFDVINTLNRKVYYAGSRITDRLQIHAVPSAVYQDGNKMSIEEIFIESSREGKNDKK
jgi:conjugal transfer pilus assembly protein TraW